MTQRNGRYLPHEITQRQLLNSLHNAAENINLMTQCSENYLHHDTAQRKVITS